jgi:hypothetical protein
VDRLSAEELRALELDENTERVDYLDYETSKQRLTEMLQAEADAKEQAQREAPARATSGTTRTEKRPHRASGKKRTGRPKKPGSRRDVAERAQDVTSNVTLRCDAKAPGDEAQRSEGEARAEPRSVGDGGRYLARVPGEAGNGTP